MPLKYPLVHEFVIVIADLYLPEEGSAGQLALPGLEHIGRFAKKTALAGGWRAWLARSVGSGALAEEPPACLAARCAGAHAGGGVWLATPVHCVAGLSSVHLDHRGLLKLPLEMLGELAADFAKVFAGSGFALVPLASGGFLLRGPAISDCQAIEPARCIGASIAAPLPRAPALRRLGAEIEIWLHEHPENLLRSAHGELPATSLWIWGGGTLAATPAAPQAHAARSRDRAYGRDPYLDGLWCARGAPVQPLPARIEDVIDTPAHCIVMVVELAELLAAQPAASLGDALAVLDARFLAPAVQLLARGAVRTLTVIANDRCLALARRDRIKRWRRADRGLSGLA
jgi:hypothetical protein